jgi:TM2 domain-containing membrane protein YozV
VNRIKDPSAIEARLLELAHTTDAKITAPALAYFAPCSLADANQVLDDLTARDQLIMDIGDDGTVTYQMPGRQQLAARHVAPPPPPLSRALVREARVTHTASPLLAMLLSVFIPGAGHLYAGRVIAAVLWFLVVGAGYTLILPGLILHLFAIASSAAAAHRLNAGARRLELTAGSAY